jgi:parallel beta-helix repeat protein
MRQALFLALAAQLIIFALCPTSTLFIFPTDVAASSAGILTPSTVTYTPHSPICIDIDSNFTIVNGVTGGSGTPIDPYIIRGWEINASSAHGIEISHISVRFEIRDCQISGGGGKFSGIFLSMLSNGVVSNCTLVDNFNGIELLTVSSCRIADNRLYLNKWHGITGSTSSQNLITRNYISLNGRDGIDIRCSAGWNTLVYNEIHSNTEYGIYHARSPFSIISHNIIRSNGKTGYFMDHTANNTVTFNDIIENNGGLLVVSGGEGAWKANDNQVSSNNITSNIGDGITLEGAVNLTIYKNNITLNSDYGVNVSTNSNCSWIYSNSFTGNHGAGKLQVNSHVQACDNGNHNNWNLSKYGNYWSDWTSPDNDSDGIVDMSYTLDGVMGSRDFYPVADPLEILPALHHISVVQLADSPFVIGQKVDFYMNAWSDANETENITVRVNITWELVGGVGTLSEKVGPKTELTSLNSGMGVISITCEFNNHTITKDISFTDTLDDNLGTNYSIQLVIIITTIIAITAISISVGIYFYRKHKN